MFALTLVFICIIAGSVGQICFKTGMNRATEKSIGPESISSPETLVHIITNKYIILGMILYAFALVLWLIAMSSLDVSYMYPLLSLGYVLTGILAFLFLNENITLIRWIGVITIVVGCFLVLRT